MIIEFKYKDEKGKLQVVTKNLDPGCLKAERVYINNKYYYVERQDLHIKEPKIVVWLKR